jgi:polysaccharide export outer membrane protein
MKRKDAMGLIALTSAIVLGEVSGHVRTVSAQAAPTAKVITEASQIALPAIGADRSETLPGAREEAGSAVPMIEKLSNAVSSDFLIGAEDVLEISVWRNPDLSKTVQVRPDGRISLPVVRDVMAMGKTTSQLGDELTRKLKEYVQNPVVAISVRDVNSYNIFMLGELVKPGKYPLKSKTTLLQGITMAGGFTALAARNQVVIFRFSENGTGTRTLTASYDDIVLRGGVSQNLELKAGDTVVVPSETMVVFPGHKSNER